MARPTTPLMKLLTSYFTTPPIFHVFRALLLAVAAASLPAAAQEGQSGGPGWSFEWPFVPSSPAEEAFVEPEVVCPGPASDVEMAFRVGEAVTPIASADIGRAYAMPDAYGGFAVHMTLCDAASETFADLTGRAVGEQMIFEIEGEVVLDARVMAPILGGSLMVTGNYTAAEAEALAARIRGAAPNGE